jgi:hypothetical protein
VRKLAGRRSLLTAALIAALGLALGLGLGGGRSPKAAAPGQKTATARRHQISDKRPPNPLTKKVVACERSGKVICDPAAYKHDRAQGMFPLSKPDPTGAHLLTLQQVLPPAWRHKDYAAELMTYGKAQKIAPDLAGASSAVVDPNRKFWVLTLYHHPPITVSDASWDLPPGAVPRMIRARVESQTVDAVTGQGMDSCINCAAIRVPIHYQPEGVTLMAPLPGYRPSLSRHEALGLLRRSGIAGSSNAGHPTVKLWTVRDVRLPRGGYPAWVITFQHTSPISYGPGRVSPTPDCAWVAIYNLRASVWTEDFQNCPEKTTNYPNGHKKIAVAPSCDSGCTPANQPALDAAANYAEKVAGAAHHFTGVAVDDAANRVIVYLTHAPRSVIKELNAAHPGIYVIHNDAPRTHETLMRLENSFNFQILKREGIQVVSVGPTENGYLQVGVTSKIAEAQARLDAIYGPNIIRVFKSAPAVAWGGGPVVAPRIQGVVAIRSTQSRRANAPEVRQWHKRPIAVVVQGAGSVLRFVLAGNGCKPKATSSRIEGKTLTIFLRRGDACTLEARFYEVTVTFAKPIVNAKRIDKIVARSGSARQPMSLATVVYG